MSIGVPMRSCRKCGLEAYTEFTLSNFITHPKGLYGYANLCKDCDATRNREAKRPREYRKDYYLTNKEKIKQNVYKNRTPEQRRDYALRSKYGITLIDYNIMHEEQEGKCFTCHTYSDKLVVDHNHDTGEVRALLCNHCNSALGFSRESILVLENLIKYIEDFN